MGKQPFGLYIHIPFCISKCPYCDFCSFPRPASETMEEYVRELTRRLAAAGRSHAERSVDTVYIGGGTPTLLPLSCVRDLMRAVRDSFGVLPDAEITVECNPATADRAVLAAWREGGVDRLSIGAQSAHESELRALGRLHRSEQVAATVADARAVGIENINLDFMLGIPHQTRESLLETLRWATDLHPAHLSAYTLMLEEGTPYHRRGRAALGLPADEEEADEAAADLFETASAYLRSVGYEHYEISNFALPDRRSRHNLHTWQCREYLGLGVAAHSYMEGVRSGQSRDLSAFLRGEDITSFREVLTEADRLCEYIMLSLRLSDGIGMADFAARFGMDFRAVYGERCAPMIAGGWMEDTGERIRLSERGFLVSNAVIGEIL